MKLPVLGRWKNEDGLRDHIAKHLETLEPDLKLVEIEHPLPPLGSSE